ncbi:hypothetical protein MAP00_000889 [Monascus purpureus]|nr:hypothetical protein MAP00_000889 [Monascus purpureus]
MSSSGNPESGKPVEGTLDTNNTPVEPLPSATVPTVSSECQNSDRGDNNNNTAVGGSVSAHHDNDEGKDAAQLTSAHSTQTGMEAQKAADADTGAMAPTAAPSAEQPGSSLKDTEEDPGVSLSVTLLLTNGARHPLKIDGRYLRKYSINVPNYDPFEMSVYSLKELIWRDWHSDWEDRPSSPSMIRLISFGKLLDDKVPLSECKFNHDAPNVVHMTVKPQEIFDEDDAKGAKSQYSSHRDTGERSPGCRCIIL